MPIRHTVQQGDSTIKLADQHGFYAKTIWNHPDNAELKNNRDDMNTLMPGDVVTIPDKKVKSVEGGSEQKHRFRRKGVPAIYRVQVFDVEKPRANQKYRLVVDGRVLEGTTNGDGILEEYVPTDAREGELIIGPDEYRLLIDFGYLDPITEVAGVQKRLNNLGFYCGDPDGELNDATREAIAEFQGRFDLEATGELDDATRDKLQEIHDTQHEFPEDQDDTQ